MHVLREDDLGLLTSQRFRRDLAASLGQLLAGAARQPHVPICRARISRSAPELAALAGVLIHPDPVPARGVAMVCQLLSDGGGPLYRPACRDDLTILVKQATQALAT